MGLITLVATQNTILEIICIGDKEDRKNFYKGILSMDEKVFKRYKAI